MKKITTLALILFSISFTFAKKVKFSVNMIGATWNVNGVHIAGDFQKLAGFPADWDPATTAMTKSLTDTNMYSVVVNIPAFRKYEYKFVNGIFGYEQEFVPEESRVQYNFVDNRWIYVDSLSNDTQIVAPVIYQSNAPAGKNLVRFRVDMQNIPTISPLGVHVAGTFQGWNLSSTYMYSFDGKVYEYITYVDKATPTFQHEYKFYNGETNVTKETVPSPCVNTNGNRGVYISKDSVLLAVCFSQCAACSGNGIKESDILNQVNVFPNPSTGVINIRSASFEVENIQIYDLFGKLIMDKPLHALRGTLDLGEAKGIYFVKIQSNGQTSSSKLVIQ